MILKVETRIKKMGANLSKKKKKHHESLLAQTRTVIGVNQFEHEIMKFSK